jgi:hypothetical protein
MGVMTIGLEKLATLPIFFTTLWLSHSRRWLEYRSQIKVEISSADCDLEESQMGSSIKSSTATAPREHRKAQAPNPGERSGVSTQLPDVVRDGSGAVALKEARTDVTALGQPSAVARDLIYKNFRKNRQEPRGFLVGDKVVSRSQMLLAGGPPVHLEVDDVTTDCTEDGSLSPASTTLGATSEIGRTSTLSTDDPDAPSYADLEFVARSLDESNPKERLKGPAGEAKKELAGLLAEILRGSGTNDDRLRIHLALSKLRGCYVGSLERETDHGPIYSEGPLGVAQFCRGRGRPSGAYSKHNDPEVDDAMIKSAQQLIASGEANTTGASLRRVTKQATETGQIRYPAQPESMIQRLRKKANRTGQLIRKS